MTIDKYAFYQAAVQDPVEDTRIYSSIYESLRGSAPRVLREDFCGTFAFSCAWAKAHPRNLSLAIDLDSEPLKYGKAHNMTKLSAAEKKRLIVRRQNVMTVTSPKADLIVANNFSFNVFKRRGDLLRYFKAARRSLAIDGMIAIEVAGGADMMKKGREQRTVVRDAGQKFVYSWEQKSFNPATSEGLYAIHFTVGDRKFKDSFVYDWRLWSVAETRDALSEAGFGETRVFWERYVLGEPTGHYICGENMPNDDFYLAYVVGLCTRYRPTKSSDSQ